jgi:hypothetical protein
MWVWVISNGGLALLKVSENWGKEGNNKRQQLQFVILVFCVYFGDEQLKED